MKLSDLPNIGSVLEKNLIKSGIKTPDELIKLGTKKAFKMVKIHYKSDSCINMLYALEGAIQGIRWHSLARERKKELLDFYNSLID